MRRLLPALILALAVLAVGSCGVEFDTDKFCFKCAEDADCGEGFHCTKPGAVGFCVSDDAEEAAASPCNPPEGQ